MIEYHSYRLCSYIVIYIYRERERERERERQRETERDRERQRERQRETETDRDRDRDRQTDRERQRQTETERRYSNVQACFFIGNFLLRIFALEGFVNRAFTKPSREKIRSKRFSIKNMFGLCYTFST